MRRGHRSSTVLGAACVLLHADVQGGVVCTGPAAGYARISPQSVGQVGSQFDFIKNEFLPTGELVAPYEDASSRIQFVKQIDGPNLDGTPFCGVLGTP